MAAPVMGPANSTSYSDSKGMVTACESYLPMVKLMRKVLRANGIERGIHIINERLDELEVGRDIASQADVLVSSVVFYDIQESPGLLSRSRCRSHRRRHLISAQYSE
nr:protein arginine N-methyltransferase 1.6 [Ipomoea trifida]